MDNKHIETSRFLRSILNKITDDDTTKTIMSLYNQYYKYTLPILLKLFAASLFLADNNINKDSFIMYVSRFCINFGLKYNDEQCNNLYKEVCDA